MRRQRGFNLIELLIGLTISLMGLAAVSSIMMTFSKKRGAITQTMSTQDNGVMALYRLERDISQAGYGLAPLQSCTTVVHGVNTFVPYPVIIGDGGTGVSDTITVQGTNPASGIPGTELTVSGGNTMTTSAYNVSSAVGFSVDDMVVATNFLPTCTMTRVTAVNTGSTPNTISYTPALAANSTAGYLTYFGTSSSSGATLLEFFSRTYAVGATAMTVGDYPAYTAANLVDDIVFLKAQYGLAATTTSTTVTSWVSGATALTSSNVGRVIAIRVGVVARSSARENEAIDQPNPLPIFSEMADSSGGTDAVTFTIPDTRSRYRAYSTIIPLKNVIWTR
ncbi:MAG: PilW family protein [Sulfuritalea sp.]|jgi:type IV pilus assembly protein PilW|nr:PilW family protein [Sulfuritalea sp.]